MGEKRDMCMDRTGQKKRKQEHRNFSPWIGEKRRGKYRNSGKTVHSFGIFWRVIYWARLSDLAFQQMLCLFIGQALQTSNSSGGGRSQSEQLTWSSGKWMPWATALPYVVIAAEHDQEKTKKTTHSSLQPEVGRERGGCSSASFPEPLCIHSTQQMPLTGCPCWVSSRGWAGNSRISVDSRNGWSTILLL